MVNVWDFAWELGKVKIETNDGQTFAGSTIAVHDAEEADDTEDSIVVEAKSGEIRSFRVSEIKSIEVIV